MTEPLHQKITYMHMRNQSRKSVVQKPWADPEGGGGKGGPDPPPFPRGINLLIFAMLKFSGRPILGIWTPLKKISGSAHGNCTAGQRMFSLHRSYSTSSF